VAKASKEYPHQSGAVTGLLFACMSLGGMVFPLVLGILASHHGIERSYLVSLGILVTILAGLLIWIRRRKAPASDTPEAIETTSAHD